MTTSYVSGWETLSAVNDSSVPSNSNDKSSGAYGNWDTPNTLQWVQYSWNEEYELESTEIYWFDDGAGVLVPTTAYLEYWQDGDWLKADDLPLIKNTFNELNLTGISSSRLRVAMLNSSQSTGILEWRVYGDGSGVSVTPEPAEPGTVPYQAISDEFTHLNITPDNALYKDSDRFRAYYGGEGKTGAGENAAEVPESMIDSGLAHMEAAYECFVNQWGFRSASLRLQRDDGPYYKLNLYSTTTLNAGGSMGADAGMGLCFIELKNTAINAPGVTIHEYGHCLNYSAYRWNGQNATGAWWESVANWFADSYFTDSMCEDVRESRGMSPNMDTIINLEANIVLSYLPIVHTRNYYQAWPFITYITQNPDGYQGLGRLVLKDMFDNHQRNDETPLHVLERLTPVKVQSILGRYWARMAYLDIDHPKAQARFLSTLNDFNFRSRAYSNLDSQGDSRYRVKAEKQPQYAGANIIPLTMNDSQLSVAITNLGNGQSDSNYTATLSIRNTASGSVRYVDLESGTGTASISANEEVSLVVVNTPDNLIQFNAFTSNENPDTALDYIGLNYEVEIVGATPAY